MAQVVTKIEFHYKAFTKVRRSPGVVADLIRRGTAIAAAAGPGHGIETNYNGVTRARVTVMTETLEAKKAEATDKTLTRAIGAGRG